MHNSVDSGENDVACSGFTHHICESVDIKSLHCLWVRFLGAPQRLRRC